MDLTVLIRAFNSAPWIRSTLSALAASLEGSGWDAEVVLVDDGSTDGTSEAAVTEGARLGLNLRVVRQANAGRFLAGWAGVQAAAAEHLLVLDSRVVVTLGALRHLKQSTSSAERDVPWNGHVDTDPTVPLVGRFWEVPTHVFWSEYLARPRPIEITEENFDRVPKGIGFFYIAKSLFQDACRVAWPTGETHLVSDDTKLLRYIASVTPIRLDPAFAAIYRPRTSVRQFLRHAYDRGTLFVDSYAGTTRLRNAVLVTLAVAPVAVLLLLVLLAFADVWAGVGAVMLLALLLLAAPAVLALLRACPPRAMVAYVIYIVPFGAVFWAGLVRGLVVHRRLFRPSVKQGVDS